MSDVYASVLIPVKNGGKLLGEVLDAVLGQRTPWPFEVVVIDSGSDDGSVELVRQRGITCHCIDPKEFGHGRTRNQLASLAAGRFLVFITQDALPASNQWLSSLVEGCELEPDVAGSFGPHQAYPHARLVTRRELTLHFAGFGPKPSVVRVEDQVRFEADPGYRQWLHFFSSNNACIRRSVWEKIPLPEVAFAEDQTWALQAVSAGYAKGYAPDALVFHSHDFGVMDTLRRNFDESRSFAIYFGYQLQPSLPRALASVLALTRRDYRWLRDEVRGPRLWGAAVMSAMLEFARISGQYLGTRHAELPRFLTSVLSRDERIQRKGRA